MFYSCHRDFFIVSKKHSENDDFDVGVSVITLVYYQKYKMATRLYFTPL